MPDKNLPTNWSWVKLGDVCEFVYGKGLIKTNRNGTGKFPVYGSNGIVGFHDEYLVEGPCLIVGRKGAAGEIHLSNKNCWPIDTTYYIKKNEKFSLTYLYFVLKKIRLDFLDKSTAIPGLNRNDAYKLTIPLPPLSVQKKIVEKIEQLFSELDSGVVSLKKAKEQIKTYRQAVLASAFSGRLCRNLIYQIPFGEQKNFINEIPTNSSPDHLNPIQVRNLINKDDPLRDRQEVEIEILPYKQRVNIAEERVNAIQEVTSINKAAEPQTQYGLNQDSLDSKISRIKSENKSSESVNLENPGSDNYANNLPEGWKWVKISDAGKIVTGTTPSKKVKEYYGNDFPFYKPTDLNAGINTRDAIDNISKLGASKARLLPEKSILITCIGATIGKTGLNKIPGISNQQINAIIPNKNYLSEFVYYFCISKFFQNQIKSNASSTTLPILNKSKFELLSIIQIPLNQQTQIVEEIEKRFSEADNLEKAIDESLTKAESLRQSILKQAFEGKLV
ncbi:MAG: restriction endonuclease subunit S [Ignavibacteriaceae bacterium]